MAPMKSTNPVPKNSSHLFNNENRPTVSTIKQVPPCMEYCFKHKKYVRENYNTI